MASRTKKSSSPLAPMLAWQEPVPPITDDDWLYEIKYDGYRCLAAVQNGRAQLFSRNLNDCTVSYPEVVDALRSVRGGPHILDGELCTLKDGVADFNAFHQLRANRGLPPKLPMVTFAVFDLLLFDGQDVTGWPLEQRKTLLQLLLLDAGLEPLDWGDSVRGQLRLVDGPPPGVMMVADLRANAAVFAALVGAGLPIEGVVAKRRDSTYTPGERSGAWLKIKRPGWQVGREWKPDR